MVSSGDGGQQDGIWKVEGGNAVVLDPVKLLNASYWGYAVSGAGYYSRCLDFTSQPQAQKGAEADDGRVADSRKRKRSKKKEACLNEKEKLAEARHQQVREAILGAHEAMLAASPFPLGQREQLFVGGDDVDFRNLAGLWQAPLYEITLSPVDGSSFTPGDGGKDGQLATVTLFNSMIRNDSETEVIAECCGCRFLVPRHSKFLISDIRDIRQLIPVNALDGYNLLILDPPWESKSLHRKNLYPTLPNKHLLSLPIRQLVHPKGALLGMWITNREKMHQFVERELFPAWGVFPAASWYWLKLTPEGKMLSPLDLAHHKPYECLLLGYVSGSDTPDMCSKTIPDRHVIMSVPGEHSRKPALGPLLMDLAPGQRPVRALELFARELHAGWTSWGNEPLHFQNLKYFFSFQQDAGDGVLSHSHRL